MKPIEGVHLYGTVVGLIVQNKLNHTILMYKHGDPPWILGSAEKSKFEWKSINEAVKHSAPSNLKTQLAIWSTISHL